MLARKKTPAVLLLLVLLLAGCAKNTPVPTPPQVQVANSINALAQSLDAATSGLIAARDQGKLSQADLTAAFKVITALSVTGKQLNAELRSADTWDVQKTRMRQLIVAAGIGPLSAVLPPTARAIMLTAITTFNVISAGVGGPTL